MISSLNLRRDHGSPAADSKSDSFSTSSLASRAKPDIARCSSVRLLETRSGTTATELLGLATTGVGDKEGFVVLDEELLKLALGGLVLVLLSVSNDGLTDGHNLGGLTTTTDADAHVKVLETRLAEKENGLPGLHPHRGGLHNVHRLSIDTNISFASCNCGNSGGVLLATKGLH